VVSRDEKQRFEGKGAPVNKVEVKSRTGKRRGQARLVNGLHGKKEKVMLKMMTAREGNGKRVIMS